MKRKGIDEGTAVLIRLASELLAHLPARDRAAYSSRRLFGITDDAAGVRELLVRIGYRIVTERGSGQRDET